MPPDPVVAATCRWIANVVVGLNLCPFAKRVFDARRIHFAVSNSTTENALLLELDAELKRLVATPRDVLETTLLIHPHVLTDFLDFNDFLERADRRIRKLRLTGVVQLASFHPDYQFAGTSPDDVENFTNRSPFPMLHLLREESISELAMDDEALEAIPARNIELLRAIGREEMARRWQENRGDESSADE